MRQRTAFNASEVDGLKCGHTWKCYYLYLNSDGTALREYAAVKITQAQLKKASGGAAVLKAIRQHGGAVKSIWYRSNGLVHINYRKGTEYDYVTMKLAGTKLSYVVMDSEAGTKLARATDSGIDRARGTSLPAKYKKWPLS